jgi:hypothetical protein
MRQSNLGVFVSWWLRNTVSLIEDCCKVFGIKETESKPSKFWNAANLKQSGHPISPRR